MTRLSSCMILLCLCLATGGNLAAQPAVGNTAAAVFVHAWLPEVGPLPSPPLPHEVALMRVARSALQGNFQAAMQQLGELQKTSTDPRLHYLVPLFQHALHWRRMLLVGGGLSRGDAQLLVREFGPPAKEWLDTAAHAAQSLGPSHYDELLAAFRQYFWLQTCVDQLPTLNVALPDGTVLVNWDKSEEQKQIAYRESLANGCAQPEGGGMADAPRELLTTFVAARLAIILRQDPQVAREHYGRGLELAQRHGWQRAAVHWLLHLGDLAAAPYGDVLSLGYLLVTDPVRVYASILANADLVLPAHWGITPQALSEAEHWYAAAHAAAATAEEPVVPAVFAVRTAYLAFRRGEPSADRLYAAAANAAEQDGAVLTAIMAQASLALLRGEHTPFAEAFDVASRQQYPGAMLSVIELAISHAMRLRARGEGFAAATTLAIPVATLPEQGWERARADLLTDLSRIESALGRQEASVRRMDDAIASRKRHIARLEEAAQHPRASLPDILESIPPFSIEAQKHGVAVATYDLLASLKHRYINENLAQWQERIRQVGTILPRTQDVEKFMKLAERPDIERANESLRTWHGQEDCVRVLRSFAQQDSTRPPNEQPRALVQSLVMASECDDALLKRAQAVLEPLDPVAPVAAALRQFRQETSFPALLELRNTLAELRSFFLHARQAYASAALARWAHEASKLAQGDALLAGLVPAAKLRHAQALLLEGKPAQAHPLLKAILDTGFLQSPTAFRELRMDVLYALVDVHVPLDRPAEALLAVERLRAEQDWWQAVITRVHEADPQSAELAMLEREAALNGSGSTPRLLALERQALTGHLPPRPHTLTPEALRAALDGVPRHPVVLAYHPVREHLVIWRAERGQPLRMILVPAGSRRLGRLLAQFKQHLIEDHT